MRHTDLPDGALAGHAYGWVHVMERLGSVCLGQELGPDDWRQNTTLDRKGQHDYGGWRRRSTDSIWQVYPAAEGVVYIAQIADQDRVALFYRPQTAVTEKTIAAEVFTVRDAKSAKAHWLSIVYPTPRQPPRPNNEFLRCSRFPTEEVRLVNS